MPRRPVKTVPSCSSSLAASPSPSRPQPQNLRLAAVLTIAPPTDPQLPSVTMMSWTQSRRHVPAPCDLSRPRLAGRASRAVLSEVPWAARPMGRPRRRRAKEPVIAAASLCVIAVLAGCSAPASSSGVSSAGPPARTAAHSAVASAQHPAAPSDGSALAFTVAGTRPVLPSGSQDTHAQTPDASCDSSTFAADKALGARVAHGFALTGFPASADLLTHFLKGKGAGVDYRAGSPISKQALASGAFRAVDNEVTEAILRQLK